ncbi:MAG: hypothetical protein ACTHWA_09325 [Arachnia sp.]
MSSGQQQAGRALEDPSIRTYRYVRAAIIGSMLLLFISLALQVASDGWAVKSSISEYYYYSVRGVLIGTLVTTGVALVAIQGRPGLEETALNLAGMLAPVVALVPTPLLPLGALQCVGSRSRCIPEEFLAGVVNNMSALLLLGVPLLAFAWWTALSAGRWDLPTRKGLAAATGVWALFALWFGPTASWPLRDSFLAWSHYASAIAMFGSVIVVVWYNALRTDCHFQMGRRPVSFRLVYFGVAAAMALTLLVSVVLYFGTVAESRQSLSIVFWLESVLLVLFVIFWVAQTVEFWDEGLPFEARETGRGR